MKPPADAHGFAAVYADSQRKSGAGSALISVSLDETFYGMVFITFMPKQPLPLKICNASPCFLNLNYTEQDALLRYPAQ